jgi:hypothetical protein
MHVGPGPFFPFERLVYARRWLVYAGRSLMVAALLAAMTTIAGRTRVLPAAGASRGFTKLGESYFHALIGVELARRTSWSCPTRNVHSSSIPARDFR